jgi:hypothetical protein
MPSLYLRFGKPHGETTSRVVEPKAATA